VVLEHFCLLNKEFICGGGEEKKRIDNTIITCGVVPNSYQQISKKSLNHVFFAFVTNKSVVAVATLFSFTRKFFREFKRLSTHVPFLRNFLSLLK